MQRFTKQHFLLPIVFFLSTTLVSQNPSVDWGPEFKSKYKSRSEFEIIGNEKDKFYIKHNRIGRIYIEEVSKDVNTMTQHKFKHDYINQKMNVRDGYLELISYERNVNHTFASVMIGSETADDITDYYTRSDMEGNIIEETVISDVEYVEDSYTKGFFNDSLITVVNTSKSEKKEPTLEVYVSHFRSGKRSTSKPLHFVLDYPVEEIEIEEYATSKSGKTVFVVSTRLDKNADKEFRLLAVNSDGEVEKDQPMNLDGYGISNISMEIMSDNELFVAGTYHIKKDEDNVSLVGFFLMDYDIEGLAFENISSMQFTPEVISKYEQDRKGNVDMSGWFDIEIFPSETGGGYLLAEHRKVVYVRTRNGTSKRNYFKELLSMKFDKDADLKNMVMIPKNQLVGYTLVHGASYLATVEDGDLYLFFNDHEDNAQAKDMKDIESITRFWDDCYTIMCKVGDNGVEQRDMIVDNDDFKFYFIPNKSLVDGETVFLGMMKGNKTRFGTLNL